jgi:hypothetical protein
MIALVPHAPAGLDDRLAVAACARRPRADVLRLEFRLAGALAAVRIPPPEPPRIAPDLWRHTCLEAFVGHAGAPAYCEVNLSPSGAWAVRAFRTYRDGVVLDDPALAPALTVAWEGGDLQIEATLSLAAAPTPPADAAWCLGLAAVVEDHTGALSYWALGHPRPRPDFHDRAGWTQRLEAPAAACEGGRS